MILSQNESILRSLYDWFGQSDTLLSVATYVAQYAGHILLACLVVYLFTHKRGVREGFRDVIVVLSAASIAWVVAYILKDLFPSPRPFVALTDIVARIDTPHFDSFPSGHATFFMALAASMFFYHRFVGTIFFIGALCIGIARVASGIHWPSDILVGYVIGIGIGLIAHFSITTFFKKIGILSRGTPLP